MFRFVFVNVIIFGMMSIRIPIKAPQTSNVPAAGPTLYFPFIARSGPQLIVTTLSNCQVCIYYDALGYIVNPVNQPYTVTLEANIFVVPYPGPSTPAPPYSYTVQFKPALEAALPGQINPFSLQAMCYKTCGTITSIYIKKSEPIAAGNYYPLTILQWDYENPVLSGISRNDSSQTLYNTRIVVANLDQCPWKEATLNDVTLTQGQQTEFTVAYSSDCINEHLIIVGQGSTAAP